MSDLVTFGEALLRISPQHGDRLERAQQLDCFVAGAESNVAVAAERLGAASTWLSKLPSTSLGERVAGELHHNGVQTELCWSDTGRQGLYFRENGGAPRSSNVLYDREHSAFRTVTADELDLTPLRDARAFFTTGTTPALSSTTRETTMNLLKVAHEAGTMTAFDVNYHPELCSVEEARQIVGQLFPAIDVLFVSSADAARVLGLDGGQAAQYAHSLAAEHDFRTVVVTKGEHGAVAWHDSVVHEHDVFETDTLDPSGTGDAFVGAFLARRLAGDDVPSALAYGSAAAALKRTVRGDVAAINKSEVDRLVSEQNSQRR